MDQRFVGKTVIVTGASSGIGAGIARRFAAEGANVVAAARRQDRLDQLAAEIGVNRVLPIVTDVTQPGDLQEMVRAGAERFGGIDVLVSNAGYGMVKSFEETTPEDWRQMMSTDLDSCFHGAQAAAPYLKLSRGSIVHIASASGLGGDRHMTAYNAAKGAVVNFARGLAFDLGVYGIRVNTVAPALTIGEDTPQFPGLDALVDKFNQRRALTGYSTPADVAAAVAFLASEDARFITGAVLPVDGGVTAGSGQPDLLDLA